jgi:hypothetical protein
VDAGGTGAASTLQQLLAGPPPAAGVPLQMSGGLFSVPLGDTSLAGMTRPLDEAVFTVTNTYLRVWFSQSGAAGTFEPLEPNQRFTSVPYALRAKYADNGPSGPSGAQGASGPQGPAGPAGAQGASGPSGPQGSQGVQGDLGPTGPTSSADPSGAQSASGPTSPSGTDGLEGSAYIGGASEAT